MTAATPRTGADCKLYYNSATNASPTWVEVKECGDLSMPDFGINLAEVNIRDSAWEMSLIGRLKAAVEFGLLYNPSNAVWQAIKAAFLARTPMMFAVMDQAIATIGAEGLKAFFNIESFPITQNLDETSMVDVRLSPAYKIETAALVPPTWLVVAS